METTMKLRHDVWEVRKKLMGVKTTNNKVDEMVKMLKDVENKLGVLEGELQVAGGVLVEEFQTNINKGLSLFQSLLLDLQSAEAEKLNEDINKAFLPWLNEKRTMISPLDVNSSGGIDVDQIIDTILKVDDRVFAIPIIGKNTATSVAQRVYHDKHVQLEFEVKHWVCMCEIAHEHPSKLLDCLFRQQAHNDEIKEKFHSIVNGKRYLLVLDGVTQADLGFLLSDLLGGVSPGSKILLTSSSNNALGDLNPLFVPDGAPFEVSGEDLHQVSSKSFHQKRLTSNIEQCERYCSLFPKDCEFDKMDLIHLWATQENMIPASAIECEAELLAYEDCFAELLSNGFFSEKASATEVFTPVHSYKMNKMENERLEDVAKSGFCCFDEHNTEDSVDYAGLKHISFIVNSSWSPPSWLSKANKLESLLFLPNKLYDSADVPNLNEILSGLTCLRALNLTAINCENLSIEKLKELRYLKLGFSSKRLPQSITELHNLQTLDLRHSGIVSLPENFHELKNLRHLYTGGKLIKMPPKFEELIHLQTLDVFIVREIRELDLLIGMNNLIGKLTIRFPKHFLQITLREPERFKYMNITDLSLVWSCSPSETESDHGEIDLMDPPLNLKSITISGYNFPQKLISWNSIFNSLTSINIEHCKNCKSLRGVSKLPYLKFLQLWDLSNLEYIEDDEGEYDQAKNGIDFSTESSVAKQNYFPSLEYVMLANLPELAGWSSRKQLGLGFIIQSQSLSISVSSCQKMNSMPLMRGIVSLVVYDINAMLLKNLLSTIAEPAPSKTLRKLEIASINQVDRKHDLDALDALSITKLSVLELLVIRRCPGLRKLELVSLDSLEQLQIHDCGNLQEIKIHCCPKLEQIIPKSFRQRMSQQLDIQQCPKLSD